MLSGIQVAISVVAGLVSLVVTGSVSSSLTEVLNRQVEKGEATTLEVEVHGGQDREPEVVIVNDGDILEATPRPRISPSERPAPDARVAGCENLIQVEINGRKEEICDDDLDGRAEFNFESDDNSVRVRSQHEVNGQGSVKSSTKVNVSTD